MRREKRRESPAAKDSLASSGQCAKLTVDFFDLLTRLADIARIVDNEIGEPYLFFDRHLGLNSRFNLFRSQSGTFLQTLTLHFRRTSNDDYFVVVFVVSNLDDQRGFNNADSTCICCRGLRQKFRLALNDGRVTNTAESL